MMAKITAHLRELLEDSSGAPDPMDLAAICDAMDAAYDIACRRYEAALVALEREQGERAELVDEGVRRLEKALDASTARVDELCKENEKLRGLVRVFYYCTTSGRCDYCPINGGGTVKLMADTICDTLHDRMCELEIEVDGA